MANNDSEIKLIIELIEKTNENVKDKFEYINTRLVEHFNDNAKDFKEIKTLIEKDTESSETTMLETVAPIKELLIKHDKDIQEIKTLSASYVKDTVCKINEAKIQEFFNKITKKLIIYNVIFLIIYVVLLYNSNITIDWPNFFGFITGLKKIFF